MGLCVVAACLPSVRPIFRNTSPKNLFSSLRSMLSLGLKSSLRLKRNEHTETRNTQDNYDEMSNASKARFLPQSAHGSQLQTETHIMRDLEAQPGISSSPIRVQKEFDHRLPRTARFFEGHVRDVA